MPSSVRATGGIRTHDLPIKELYPLSYRRGSGDIDKLARAVLDGVSDARVWLDDAQVVSLSAAKSYGVEPGCAVAVSTFDPLGCGL